MRRRAYLNEITHDGFSRAVDDLVAQARAKKASPGVAGTVLDFESRRLQIIEDELSPAGVLCREVPAGTRQSAFVGPMDCPFAERALPYRSTRWAVAGARVDDPSASLDIIAGDRVAAFQGRPKADGRWLREATLQANAAARIDPYNCARG